LTQSHVVVPYAHIMVAGVEQAMPGAGCVVGQGALQRQLVMPIAMAPASQRQVVEPKSHEMPSPVHAVPLVGSVPGQAPQLHLPITQAQSVAP
jgi:hypothetical protein